ncbi:hypothetical protein AALO_G00303900 [Alosa alosa]|uniref:C-type lectin domain-containing protein n=1 Tax=Alosa alosa TaxID=278164 RepID=A0AAV6FLY6_9TELE|nr:neurocan core protein-like [Alosa alosa]KAG5261386.1 hypothetical protein AALO_G00303900 [Alosa alosa]
MCAAIYGFDILMFGIMNAWLSDPCGHIKHFVCFDQSRGLVVVDEKKDWTSAQTYCRTHHTDLASVGSDAESGQIWAARPSGAAQMWIGLFSDDWSWTDGTGSSFRNWQSGQPDNGVGEGCAGLLTNDSGRWADFFCTSQYSFICAGAPRAKRLIVRVKIRSAQENMTSEITDHLLHQLVAPWAHAPDMKASWQRCANGEIFIREEDKTDDRPEERGTTE